MSLGYASVDSANCRLKSVYDLSWESVDAEGQLKSHGDFQLHWMGAPNHHHHPESFKGQLYFKAKVNQPSG